MTINQSSALVRQSPTEAELRDAAAIAWRSHFSRFWWNWRERPKVYPLEANSVRFAEGAYFDTQDMRSSTPGLGRKLGSREIIVNQCLTPYIDHMLRVPQVLMFDMSTTYAISPSHCEGCKNYYGQIHGGNLLVCAIHPSGIEGVCKEYEAGYNQSC